MSDPGTRNAHDRGWLADWRRLVAELYAEVRILAESDPGAAWEDWRSEREALYRGHPQSPLPVAERESFRAVHWRYDERLRFVPPIEPDEPGEAARAFGRPAEPGPLQAPLALPNSGAEEIGFDRLGVVRLGLPTGDAALPVFWMRGYAGGVFLPFRDATNGDKT